MKKIFIFTLLIVLSLSQSSCDDDSLKNQIKEIREYLVDTDKMDDSVQTSEGVFVYTKTYGTFGDATPAPSETVEIQYTGYLFPDGEQFDSSNGNTLRINNIGSSSFIEGFRVGLQEMRKGDVAEIYIPADLAYGTISDRPTGSGVTIKAGSILTFEVTMVDFF